MKETRGMAPGWGGGGGRDGIRMSSFNFVYDRPQFRPFMTNILFT